MKQNLNIYGVPPFNVLDSKQKAWKKRRGYWDRLGIQSELGRDEYLTFDTRDGGFVAKEIDKRCSTTSVFNPVLCELIYNWYTAPGMSILDPFAGGSVRGIVAAKMRRSYMGIDLRKEQVDANVIQGNDIVSRLGNSGELIDIVDNVKQDPDDATYPMPIWHCDDSTNIGRIVDNEFDFIFSCPPYGNLEVYSDLKEDISNMDWEVFLVAYRKIIGAAVSKLKNNRFAAFVVSDFRNNTSKGNLNPLVYETLKAFEEYGMHYYANYIYVTPAGTLPLRAFNSMITSRKPGPTYQNVIVFVKGDGKAAGTILNNFSDGVIKRPVDAETNNMEGLW